MLVQFHILSVKLPLACSHRDVVSACRRVYARESQLYIPDILKLRRHRKVEFRDRPIKRLRNSKRRCPRACNRY